MRIWLKFHRKNALVKSCFSIKIGIEDEFKKKSTEKYKGWTYDCSMRLFFTLLAFIALPL